MINEKAIAHGSRHAESESHSCIHAIHAKMQSSTHPVEHRSRKVEYDQSEASDIQTKPLKAMSGSLHKTSADEHAHRVLPACATAVARVARVFSLPTNQT